MASFVQLPSGNWRTVVRRKARYAAETFRRKADAESWALEMERRIDPRRWPACPGQACAMHAAAVHGVAISKEPIELARVALRRLGLLGMSRERDRRPTQTELDAPIAFLDGNPRQLIPVGRIIRFAVATAMRQSEIASIVWPDVDDRVRIVVVRDRKDPRKKDGNHQHVPLIALTGYDAWAILEEQRRATNSVDRIFPYDGKR